MKNVYKILARKPERKRQFVWPRRRWQDNIGMDLREIGWEGVAWINLAQNRDQWQALVRR
jgi:hypothetical protein